MGRRANFRRKRSIASKIGREARSHARNRNRSAERREENVDNENQVQSIAKDNTLNEFNELEKFLEGVDLDDAVEAATKIQAITRGRKTRVGDAAKNDCDADEDDDDDEELC